MKQQTILQSFEQLSMSELEMLMLESAKMQDFLHLLGLVFDQHHPPKEQKMQNWNQFNINKF